MKPRYFAAIHALIMALVIFAMATAADAKPFQGLMKRRALNDPSVTSTKVFTVDVKQHKHKASKRAKGRKKSGTYGNLVRRTLHVKAKAKKGGK